MKKIFIVFIVCCLLLSISGCGGEQGGEYSCTIRITCGELLENIDLLDEEKRSLVPEDGILLDDCVVSFSEGDSVFDILLRAVRENNIHMEYSTSPVFNTSYIEGIGNLYEFDCGAESGWKYSVNGEIPSLGASAYDAGDGDIIEFFYALEAGEF